MHWSTTIFQMAIMSLMAAAIFEWDSSKATADDIGTNFFLKTSKSVPRIGRRSMMDLDNYFMKASKSVPRIGRRRDLDSQEEILEPARPDKRFYTENGWGSVEHSAKDYPDMMQGDEPYREIEQFPDVYWQQMKRNVKLLAN